MFHFVAIILQVCRGKLENCCLLVILLGWAISGSMCIILVCNDACKKCTDGYVQLQFCSIH